MQEIIKDLQNTAVLYCEDRENGKPTERIKNWLAEIIEARQLKTKYSTAEEITARAYDQLENIYKATKTKNIEETSKELGKLYNIFTLACWILTTLHSNN